MLTFKFICFNFGLVIDFVGSIVAAFIAAKRELQKLQIVERWLADLEHPAVVTTAVEGTSTGKVTVAKEQPHTWLVDFGVADDFVELGVEFIKEHLLLRKIGADDYGSFLQQMGRERADEVLAPAAWLSLLLSVKRSLDAFLSPQSFVGQPMKASCWRELGHL